MNEFINSLYSINWWISVVVVGLIINIISGYIKTPIDSIGLWLFGKIKRRTKQSQEAYRAKIEALRRDTSSQFIALLQAQRHRSRSNGWLIFSAMALLGYTMGGGRFLLYVLIACTAMASLATNSAIYLEELVDEARKPINKKSDAISN